MKVNPWRVLLKALLLFVVFNFAVAAFPPRGIRASIYNHLVPGRERLPFGENPTKAYNLSLFDLDAMFASHVVSQPAQNNTYRVLIIGDSSVWGTLLRPEETLAGQLNALHLTTPDGRAMRFYNLGYPTIALSKDLLLLHAARQASPDLILWLTTLEAFPEDKQFATPLVAHNLARLERINAACPFTTDPTAFAHAEPTFWERTLINRRRAWADWYRLQVYGVMWWITGIDQFYPPTYAPAKTDFDADVTFHKMEPGADLGRGLAWDTLRAGFCLTDETPMILINEPILISHGKNSDLRYNYFYPRWAYDAYRQTLQTLAQENNWRYADYWDLVPPEEFTNSAVHLTSQGEALLAQKISALLADYMANR